jgi:hypothetical protein
MSLDVNINNSKSLRNSEWLPALLYAFWILLVSLVMLYFNSLLSFVLIEFLPKPSDGVAAAAIAQLFFYVVPVVLTFMQWAIFDRIRRVFAY